MAEKVKIEGVYKVTKPVVLAFPHLFEPKSVGKSQDKPKYETNLVLDAEHPDLNAMKQLAIKVARQAWPARDFKASPIKFPFANGTAMADKRKAKSGKDDGDYQRGKVVIAARSKYQPNLGVILNGKILDLADDTAKAAHKGKFFFGAEALVEVNFQPYEGVGANPDGVTCYLNKVLVTGGGTRIAGGGASVAETFSGYVGNATTEDPTGASDDIDMGV